MEEPLKTKAIGRFPVRRKEPHLMTPTVERLAVEALSRSLSRYAGQGKESLAQDRAIFISAIHRTAKANEGVVNANLLRPFLTDEDGNFVIDPQSFSSMHNALIGYGNLVVIGQVPNTDVRSGNQGKLINHYRLNYYSRR
ncbi:hypothetical protein [Arthrobacter sp. lap29]|uniref:hypothetical protein n=1 Tax=Arthrobacter sp. lap29 TaxID=3056122 RepID=UPI0028F6F755|nr:hypothetical protein [Arthrobacter sp. lap29]